MAQTHRLQLELCLLCQGLTLAFKQVQTQPDWVGKKEEELSVQVSMESLTFASQCVTGAMRGKGPLAVIVLATDGSV